LPNAFSAALAALSHFGHAEIHPPFSALHQLAIIWQATGDSRLEIGFLA